MNEWYVDIVGVCSYRTRDEIQEVRQTRDPITGFRDRLLKSGLATAEELKVSMHSRGTRLGGWVQRLGRRGTRVGGWVQRLGMRGTRLEGWVQRLGRRGTRQGE